MKLLAISGGPDSMFLLDRYKNKKIVVAHVNYHKRKDSNIDEKIVVDFCNKHNIACEVLNLKNKKATGNFQSWARKVRYDFFKEVYDKHSCDQLLTAHHKDDFIETALMQQQSGRTPRYFGIKDKNELFGMNIYRPFVDTWFKDDILKVLNKRGIAFATDSSNAEPVFERNKVRIELNKKSQKEKQDIFEWFVMSNKILKKKFKKVEAFYKLWKKSGFDLSVFRNFKKDKQEIIYEYIHDNFDEDIKLSTKKMDSIIDFINGLEGNRIFKLNTKHSIQKLSGKLIRK